MIRNEFTPKKVAVYFRVSTHRQDYALQKNAFKEWLSKREDADKLTVTVYEEKISGKGKHRPKYESMMARALAGEHDTIVTWKFDRLSRDFLAGMTQLIELVKNNIRVLFLDNSGSCLNNLQEHGPMLFTSIASFMMMAAQMERDNTSERIKQAFKAKKEKDPSWKPGRKYNTHRKFKPEQELQILRMRDVEGLTWGNICKVTGAGKSTLIAICQRLRKEQVASQTNVNDISNIVSLSDYRLNHVNQSCTLTKERAAEHVACTKELV